MSDAGGVLDGWGLRRLALVVGGCAILLEIVVLTAIGQSSLGSRGVLVALAVSLVLVTQGIVLLALVLLLRQHRNERVTTERYHTELLRRSRKQGQRLERVAARSRDNEVRVTNLAAGQNTALGEILNVRAVVEHARSNLAARTEQFHLDTQRQVQALLTLERIVKVEGVVPPMGGWAASPDLVVLCVRSVLEERPATVVECGSGVSTLFLALAVAQHQLPTRIVALEHDEHYARATQQLLEHHGVQDRVELRLAPLEPTTLTGHDTSWYAESALADLDNVGLLLVDGPPGTTGPHARYPALPLLRDRLSPRCLILMDDVNREEDREVAERWAAESPDFELEIARDFQKQVGLLRRQGHGAVEGS